MEEKKAMAYVFSPSPFLKKQTFFLIYVLENR